MPPEQMFRSGEFEGQFKEFDADGFPTVGADGQPLSKALSKKLAKLREAQVKAYDAWRASAAGAGEADGSA